MIILLEFSIQVTRRVIHTCGAINQRTHDKLTRYRPISKLWFIFLHSSLQIFC